MENDRYIQFPISLLSGIHKDRSTAINEIVLMGIYGYSKRFKYDLRALAKQIIYMVYRSELSEFKAMLNEVGAKSIGNDDDYNGFNGKVFDPADEIHELLQVFEMYSIIKEYAIDLYQFHLALESISLRCEIERTLKKAKEIYNKTQKGDAMAMIKASILLDFRDNYKTDFEVTQLLAYCALKSIIGKKKVRKTNRTHLVCRMLGYKSKKEISNEVLNESEFKRIIDVRYQWDKLRDQLEINWKVKFYSKGLRGFCFSDGNKLSYEAFILDVESKKKRS